MAFSKSDRQLWLELGCAMDPSTVTLVHFHTCSCSWGTWNLNSSSWAGSILLNQQRCEHAGVHVQKNGVRVSVLIALGWAGSLRAPMPGVTQAICVYIVSLGR